MFADKDEFLHSALLQFLFSRREKRGENTLAAEIWMYHAGKFFFFPAIAFCFKIARKLPIDIIQEIIGLVPTTVAQHLHANAHTQPIILVANINQSRDFGDFAWGQGLFCNEALFTVV